jgi:hypothetical protein
MRTWHEQSDERDFDRGGRGLFQLVIKGFILRWEKNKNPRPEQPVT